MAQPDWTKITPNGKPFGYESEEEKVYKEKISTLEKEVEVLKKENAQLRELVEEQINTKKK